MREVSDTRPTNAAVQWEMSDTVFAVYTKPGYWSSRFNFLYLQTDEEQVLAVRDSLGFEMEQEDLGSWRKIWCLRSNDERAVRHMVLFGMPHIYRINEQADSVGASVLIREFGHEVARLLLPRDKS